MLSGLLPQVKEHRWLTGGDADCVWWLDVAGSVNCCSGWFCVGRAMQWSGGVTEEEGSGFELFFFRCLHCCGCERWFDEGDRRWVADTGVKEGIWVCDEVLMLWVVVLMGLWPEEGKDVWFLVRLT